MRTDGIVFLQPLLSHFSRFGEGTEEIKVQDVLPIGTVEALDVGVLCRIARLDEIEQHVVLFSPAL